MAKKTKIPTQQTECCFGYNDLRLGMRVNHYTMVQQDELKTGRIDMINWPNRWYRVVYTGKRGVWRECYKFTIKREPKRI